MYPYNKKRSLSTSLRDCFSTDHGVNWWEPRIVKYARVDQAAGQQTSGTQLETDNLRKRIKDLENSEKEKDKKIENQRKHLNSFQRNSLTEVANLKKTVSAKEEKVQGLFKENSKLNDRLMEKDDRIIDLELDLEEAHGTISNKDDKIFELECEVEDVIATVANKDEQINNLQMDINRRKKADFKNLQDQVKYLRGQLMHAQGLICEKEVENQQLKNDKGDLENEVVQANHQVEVIEDRLNGLLQPFNTNRKRVETKREIIDEEHDNETTQERAELKSLQDKVKDLQSQVMKSAELVSQKEANIEQLVEADEVKDADIQLTETRASALEEKVKELGKQIQEGNPNLPSSDNLLKALAASKKELALKYAKIQKMVVKLDALAEDVNNDDIKLKVQDIYADALMI